MLKPVLFSELKHYTFPTFRADLFAGITVGVVALPLAMAFAIAAGFPPEKGLYTAVIAGFLISFFGGSRTQVGGPTGAFIVIIATITATHGYGGLVVASILAGMILILFGAFKMGALIKFIPFPVITGFTSGIAVVIFATQLKDIFGLQKDLPAAFIPKLVEVCRSMPQVNVWSLLLAVGTVAVILLSRTLFPKLPAMLVGMIAGTLAAQVFGLPVETIGDRFGELPSGLPPFQVPSFNWAEIQNLIMPALTIALLASIESLLSATVADGMTGDHHRPNTELTAQGIANIGAMLFGGIPATGAIARTATNIRSGAKTPVAGMIHAVTLLLIILICGTWAKLIPLAALSGIMVVVCYNMSEYHSFLRIFRGPKSDSGVMVVTFVLTVMVDLVAAVSVGVVMAALLFIRRMAEISDVKVISDELNRREDAMRIPNPDDTVNKQIPPGVEIYEVNGPFFFGAVDQFKNSIFNMLSRPVKPKVIVLHMRYVPAIDATALNVVDDLANQCIRHKIPLVLSGVQKRPRRSLYLYGITEKLGVKNVCSNIDAALNRVRQLLEEGEKN